MTFGEKLKVLRDLKCKTQSQLAKEAGIPFYTLVALEYNRTKVPLVTTVIKLADYFQMSVMDLISYVKF